MPDPISCQELVELVTAYLDDAMSETDRERFEYHLGVCPGCDDYLDQFRVTIARLGELPVETLSDDAQHSLLSAFREWPKGPPR